MAEQAHPSRFVRVALRYEGKDYVFDDPFPYNATDEDDLVQCIDYQYTQGNYSCDCNRSLFINDRCEDGPDAWPNEDEDGVMECGHRIELVSLVLVRPDGSEKVIYPEPDDAPGRVRERLAALGMAAV